MTVRASPVMPACVRTFFEIDDGSMSTWTICACGANLSSAEVPSCIGAT
jgi:hypothetical protein